MKACCVTGPRDIPGKRIRFVRDELGKEIEDAIGDGFTLFLSGFDLGTDMVFARLVIKLKEEHPQIELEAALPYNSWMMSRSEEDRELLLKCYRVQGHSKKTNKDCFIIRNQYMVKTCKRVHVVHDGRETADTIAILKYAAESDREIRAIHL